MDLVEELRARQGNLTQVQFAEKLKVDQSQLSRIYAHELGIGRKMASRIRKVYPELAFALAEYLLTEEPETAEKAAS